jgi:hypothetical protein
VVNDKGQLRATWFHYKSVSVLTDCTSTGHTAKEHGFMDLNVTNSTDAVVGKASYILNRYSLVFLRCTVV